MVGDINMVLLNILFSEALLYHFNKKITSSNAPGPSTTMFGRNERMVSGLSSLLFSSSREAIFAIKYGAQSEYIACRNKMHMRKDKVKTYVINIVICTQLWL